jgi:hypothetical protein
MTTKKRVTIYLPGELLYFAKVYAAKKGTSLSQLIEIYLESEQKKERN